MQRGRMAIVGAGWAGCAAALEAAQRGWQISLYEAAPTAGGRARSLPLGSDGVLDNGQHVLLGAYSAVLGAMRSAGANPDALLLRRALDLRTPDGLGLRMPPAARSAQGAALRAVCSARGWRWGDKAALLRRALQWRWQGFACAATHSAADVCAGLPRSVERDLIRPLCLSAFNSAPEHTSGAVFLRVLRDALFAAPGSSDMLIAKVPLGQLLPEPALRHLRQSGHDLRLRSRVGRISAVARGRWCVDGEHFDAVLLACTAREAARLAAGTALPQAVAWAHTAAALRHAPIATIYAGASAAAAHLAPMQALRETRAEGCAQCVFHHGAWSGARVLAFVCSHCGEDRAAIEAAVREQARTQLGLQSLDIIATIIERRATFICAPALQRPAQRIAAGLLACGDYVQGPYPATLEGAVRSGQGAAQAA